MRPGQRVLTVISGASSRERVLASPMTPAQVDLGHLVEEGQREAAPVEHDLLPAEAGPHQGDLAIGLRIEPVEEPDPDHQDDGENDRDDEPAHCVLPPCRRTGARRGLRATPADSGGWWSFDLRCKQPATGGPEHSTHHR